MKVSQNLYAETLLKAIGAARGGLGTVDGGPTACCATLLTAWGVPDDALRRRRRLGPVALQLRDGGRR